MNQLQNPETVATAIRIGNPASWKFAEAARDESGGIIDSVTDEEILAAYKLIASTEGVFVEPGSAASLAGVIKSVKNGKIAKGSRVVTVFTGNGLKDPDTAMNVSTVEVVSLKNDEEEIRNYIEGVTMSKKWQITVPGSTANLGPGFDSIGLSLSLYLT